VVTVCKFEVLHERGRASGIRSMVRNIILETIEASLEAQLAAIRTLRESRLRPRALKPRRERKKTNLDLVHAVLAQAGEPLHITRIVSSVRILFGGELERDSHSWSPFQGHHAQHALYPHGSQHLFAQA
jgi:hypothetical protein